MRIPDQLKTEMRKARACLAPTPLMRRFKRADTGRLARTTKIWHLLTVHFGIYDHWKHTVYSFVYMFIRCSGHMFSFILPPFIHLDILLVQFRVITESRWHPEAVTFWLKVGLASTPLASFSMSHRDTISIRV